MAFSFRVLQRDGRARRGVMELTHGAVQTPIFMPVGTQASVKTMSPDELVEIGTQILLGNTYHLYLRPRHKLIERMGGLHAFMSWQRPILTDSGGFQVFSHLKLNRITEEGVHFLSHIDGSKHFLTPELSVTIQRSLGSDIMMAFDECTPYPADHDYAEAAVERTRRWEERSKKAHHSADRQALFGIVQGGMHRDLRVRSAEQIRGIGFPGYAIGGLSVGEPKELFLEMLDFTVDLLPAEQPRYLMGVGTPVDLVNAVWMGIDMFDCVMPTRNGRNGMVFTRDGPFSIRNAEYKEDKRPIDPECRCWVCRTFSRGYIRHLYKSGEILALRLNSYHNLAFYLDLMAAMRQAIERQELGQFREQFLARYKGS